MEFRIFTEPQQGATYGQLLAVAREAERLGYDAFFRSDHYLHMGAVSGLPGPTDAWVTLGGLARETERIRLGTLVTAATFRYAGPLAISVAQVDEMSGGRVELGLGAGWYAAEHAAYAMPFPELGERFERLEEQLEIVTGMWTTPVGERYGFKGRHLEVIDSPALPKPLQQPHPPIIVGGGGPSRTPRLAATYAQEFNLAFRSLEETHAQFGRVLEACGRQGREPGSIVLSAAQVACVGSDGAELARRAAAIGREVAELRDHGLAGTPAEVVDKLGRFGEIGATRIYFQILDLADLEHLALIAEAVVAQLT